MARTRRRIHSRSVSESAIHSVRTGRMLLRCQHCARFCSSISKPNWHGTSSDGVYHLNSKSEVLTPKPGRFDLGTPCHDGWRRGGSMTRGCLLILKSIMVILNKKGIWEVVLATFSTSQMKFGNSSFQFSFYQLYHPPYIIFLPKRCIISVYF